MLDSALEPSYNLSKYLLLLPWILKLIVDMVNNSTPPVYLTYVYESAIAITTRCRQLLIFRKKTGQNRPKKGLSSKKNLYVYVVTMTKLFTKTKSHFTIPLNEPYLSILEYVLFTIRVFMQKKYRSIIVRSKT